MGEGETESEAKNGRQNLDYEKQTSNRVIYENDSPIMGTTCDRPRTVSSLRSIIVS